MDRNPPKLLAISVFIHVALRKESVDRNLHGSQFRYVSHVALRKESVDRNSIVSSSQSPKPRSLSARRAWIEIPRTLHDFPAPKVALRKESVDRNGFCDLEPIRNPEGRSPQGERG